MEISNRNEERGKRNERKKESKKAQEKVRNVAHTHTMNGEQFLMAFDSCDVRFSLLAGEGLVN